MGIITLHFFLASASGVIDSLAYNQLNYDGSFAKQKSIAFFTPLEDTELFELIAFLER